VGGDWNRRIDYDFKARNLTANGGFLLFVRFLKSLGFDKVVKAHLEVKRSRRRYSTVELFTCLISMIVLGVDFSPRDFLSACQTHDIPVLLVAPKAEHNLARESLGEVADWATLVDPGDLYEKALALCS